MAQKIVFPYRVTDDIEIKDETEFQVVKKRLKDNAKVGGAHGQYFGILHEKFKKGEPLNSRMQDSLTMMVETIRGSQQSQSKAV